jgi:hypothetical protein
MKTSSLSQPPIPVWFWLMLAVLGSAYLTLASLIPPGADTLWRLHIGQELLNGQVLYRDMIEVNPPLWFWGAMPAAFLGGYSALVFLNAVAIAITLWLFYNLLGRSLDRNGQYAATLGLAFGFFIITVGEIGQREQSFLAACALWSAIIAARIDGKTIPLWLIVFATCLAAYGFALKHYFVLVPIATEALLLWHKKRNWRPIRAETVTLALLALTYGGAVVWLTPDFLGRILDLVKASYFGFGPWNALSPFQRQMGLLTTCAFGFLPLIGALIVKDKRAIIKIMALVLGVTIGIVILQQKGWRYHLIALNGVSLVMLTLLYQGLFIAPATGAIKRMQAIGLGVLVFGAYVQFQPVFENLKTQGQPIEPRLKKIIADEPFVHHIAILSTAPDNAFFPLARAGRPHWSRHYSMWMMPGLLTANGNPARDKKRLEERARVLGEFTRDLTCRPPDIIVGEVGYFRNPEPKLFDAMAFLNEDKNFATWLDTNYVRQPDIGRYPIWRLKGTKPASINCER